MIKGLIVNSLIILIVILGLYKLIEFLPENKIKYIKAISLIKSTENSKKFKNIKGYVFFEELSSGNTKISGELSGFPKELYNSKHGFHIHETGDLRDGCKTLGGHYNPLDKDHGGRLIKSNTGDIKINFNRHIGDLGNINVNDEGKVKFSFIDPLVKLSGKYSVIGRSVVFHEGEDDLGLGGHKDSKTTGHAGSRIGCGIIGIV
jgi:Cu-Zn family superoxide dismutase